MKWRCQTSSTSILAKVVQLIVFKIVLQVSICLLTRWCAFSTTASDPQPSWPVHIVHKADQAVTRDRYAAGDTTLSAINSSTPVPGLQSGSILQCCRSAKKRFPFDYRVDQIWGSSPFCFILYKWRCQLPKYAHHLSCVSSYQILQQMHSGTGCICWHPQTIAGSCFRDSYALLKIHNTQLLYNFVIILDKTRYLVLVSEELFQSWLLIFVNLNQYAIQILWQQSSLLLTHAVFDVSKIQIFRSYVSLHVRISFFPFCLLEHALKTHQLCTFSALAASFLGKRGRAQSPTWEGGGL